jgi:hypothetical protein
MNVRLSSGLALVALVFTSCDRQSATVSGPGDAVVIAPRLVAAGPLSGARVHLSLVHGSDTAATLDTAYASGRKLTVGSVPTGDSFQVVVRGYDLAGNGYRRITWDGIVRGKATASSASVMPVDIHVDTTRAPVVDTSEYATEIYLPDSCWYSTDGTDPRVSDTGHSIHYSDGVYVPKTGILTVVTRNGGSVPGDSTWSVVLRWNFDSLNSSVRSALSGVWWEDDTNYYGRRCVYLDTFYTSGKFSRTQYDTLTLRPKSTDSGTWLVSGTSIRWDWSDGSYSTFTATPAGSNFTLYSSGSGWSGVLERNRPVASTAPYAVRFPLVGTWWETYTNTDGEVYYYVDSLRADSTITYIEYDTSFVATGYHSTGRWSADTVRFIETYQGSSDTSSMWNLGNGGFRLDYSSGAVGIFSKTKPGSGSSADPQHPAAWVGTWWEDFHSISGERAIYCDTLHADGTMGYATFDTLTLQALGTSYGGTWAVNGSQLQVKYTGGAGDTSDFVAITGGFRLTYSDSSTSTLLKTKPAASTSGSSTDTLHDATAMAALAGTWWFDTTFNLESTGDAYPVSYRYDLKVDGTYHLTAFYSTRDSVVDTASILQWGASAHTLRWTEDTNTAMVPYSLASGKVKFLDGSGDSLVRTTASLGDPALVGTWTYDADNSITINSNGAVTWIYNTTVYSYNNWSIRDGYIYLFGVNSSSQAYVETDSYTLSGTVLHLYGMDFIKN